MVDIQKLLNEHGGGALLVEVNESMQKVIKDCCDTGKKGDITMKLAFEPMPMREGGHQVKITPSVTTKNPKYDAGVGIFFVVTDDNEEPVSLEKEDPRQTSLFMSANQGVQH